MSEGKKIADSEFTIKWLEDVIKEGTNSKASITDFSSTEVGFGRGFLSQILIVKLTWDSDDSGLPKSVALKIPSFKQFLKLFESMEDDNPMKKAYTEGDLEKFPIHMAHKCEVAVYDVFKQRSPQGLKIPKSYFGRNIEKDHQGVLVLEDLSNGFGTTIVGGLTCGQMMQIAEALASLHAYSLTHQDWKLAGFNVTMKHLHESSAQKMTHDETMAMSLKQLKEWNPDIFDPFADKLLDIIKSADDFFYVYDMNSVMNLPDVFCNGDLHAQNMIWVKDEDGNASDELMALLDWQLCHPGNIGEDFARILASSLTAEIRRNHYMEILQHYYKCLTKQLGTNPPYSFDQVIEAYKRCFRYGAMAIVFGLPMICKMPALMGENGEEKVKELMERGKALIEDTLTFEDEFAV